ncbi:hypothetical protein BJY59DRAFT_141485 [Rhodotorula toruloides]
MSAHHLQPRRTPKQTRTQPPAERRHAPLLTSATNQLRRFVRLSLARASGSFCAAASVLWCGSARWGFAGRRSPLSLLLLLLFAPR